MDKLDFDKKMLLIIVLSLLVAALIIFVFALPSPRISLKGDTVISLEYGESYEEPGVDAASPLSDRKLKVHTNGSVDSFAPGTSELKYTAWFFGHRSSVTRQVIVAAQGEVEQEAQPGSESELPRFELKGDALLEHPCGRFYEEPGVIALDINGNDISSQVLFEGSVTEWECGDYVLRYSLKGEDGKTDLLTRTVCVVPAELPKTEKLDDTIYLSFDDGPSDYTEGILDILDKYNIKATFFIIADQVRGPEEERLLLRMKESGHSIGIHCYEHEIPVNYSSAETFIEDFIKAQHVIYDVTGDYACVSRFPGGSSTAMAYLNSHSAGSFDTVTGKLADMGVRWYDWNVQTEGDTGDCYNRFKTFVPGYEVPLSLQHDTFYGSYIALEKMINWALDKGYSFAAIDGSTPEIHAGTDMTRKR